MFHNVSWCLIFSFVFKSLIPSIDRAKNAMDRALGDRDVCIDKFFVSLEKDINELIHDIKEVKQAINVSDLSLLS